VVRGPSQAAQAEARQRSALIAQVLTKQPTPGMEAVYGDLLRKGTGAPKRHFELTGPLAAAAAAQDPALGDLQRALQAEPPRDAPAAAAAAAAAPPAAAPPAALLPAAPQAAAPASPAP
jgi:hypothetical protein